MNQVNLPYMDRLFPLPLYKFVKTVIKYGGISSSGLRNVPAWLVKLILLEPLRWIELTYNGRVRRQELPQDPVFILGYYRSGTSFLHELLTQDDRFGYHTNFQMILPDIMLGSEWILAPFFDFICRVFNLRDPVHRIQMSFRFPGEEDGAMTTSLNPRGAAWGWFFPKIMLEHYRKYALLEHIPEDDIHKWTDDYLFLLRKISLAGRGKRLLLKSPPHTARVKLLLFLFPKARFIMIHRNPYDVYASNKRFWQVTNRIYALGSTKGVDFHRIILDSYAMVMRKYLAEKDRIPEGQLVEIPYQELINQPLDTIRQVYQSLQLGDFSYCEHAMKNYLQGQKNYVRLSHELPPAERAMARQKLTPFLKHWGYPEDPT